MGSLALSAFPVQTIPVCEYCLLAHCFDFKHYLLFNLVVIQPSVFTVWNNCREPGAPDLGVYKHYRMFKAEDPEKKEAQ